MNIALVGTGEMAGKPVTVFVAGNDAGPRKSLAAPGRSAGIA